uniref:Aminotransferase class I/classII large domain-containing protein n=2 Tax=Ditylum brightwellii TaxID=49249 RepID=A0A7S4V4V9_9STRA|mmetsp:Transcript_25587/g.37200  ORF Transcript_25587/g.37200 Transcript_25587/m.37200 type:complete len:580 (+) Transcript_25587:118-1857(+)
MLANLSLGTISSVSTPTVTTAAAFAMAETSRLIRSSIVSHRGNYRGVVRGISSFAPLTTMPEMRRRPPPSHLCVSPAPTLHMTPTGVRSSALFSTQTGAVGSSPLGSQRGVEAVSLLPTYLADARAVPKYHPENSPNGALQLGVAENQMNEEELVSAIRKFSSGGKDEASSFESDLIYYQPTSGRPAFRAAFASYLRRLLHLPSDLDEEGLILGAGCNAVLENLCFCLAEPGEAVLIPTPYYAAFEFDLVARIGLSVMPVNTMDHHPPFEFFDDQVPLESYFPNVSSLDAAYGAAVQKGSTPRILLLSHPNNPLGICYPQSVINECIEWCRLNKVHLISDEIYAGSVYRSGEGDEATFTSALSLAASNIAESGSGGLGLGPYVHFVYALSKDFALSGLRVGAAYSENKMIRTPMQKLNDLCQISSQTQLVVERMLKSKAFKENEAEAHWTEEFLNENQRRIRKRCNRLQQCLDDVDVPYLNADSGLFLWMDMREFLPSADKNDIVETERKKEKKESMEKRERALYMEMLHDHGLLFTPGLSMRNELPGFFRCVFTAASDQEFDLGLDRIRNFVVAKRSQ